MIRFIDSGGFLADISSDDSHRAGGVVDHLLADRAEQKARKAPASATANH